MIHKTEVKKQSLCPAMLGISLILASGTVLAQDVSALGRLEPEHGVITLSTASTTHAVSGSVIRELLVDAGDWVQPGQLLAVTDSTDMLRSHQAMAERELELARLAAEAASSHADEACTLARVAESEAARRVNLLERNLASAEEAEQTQGDAEARASSCTAARSNTRVAQSSIEVAEALVLLRQAEVERSLVRAPSTGQVLEIHAYPGELAGADGLLDLARTDRMMAIAEVYETDIGRVRPGQAARVTSDALDGPLAGRVERIRVQVRKQDVIGTDPAARKDARIIEVEILLDDPGPVATLTNLQVEVIIETGS